MTDKVQLVRDEIESIINTLKKKCNPNPLGTIEECMADAQIEALEIVKDFINSLPEEPVSEDLEEAANKYADFKLEGVPSIKEMAFKEGAQWQKTKDMAVIKMTKELLEDFDKHCDEYHEAGFKHGQEALMKYAIDAKIGSFSNGTIYDADFNIDSNLKDNDKVKVIVIKED